MENTLKIASLGKGCDWPMEIIELCSGWVDDLVIFFRTWLFFFKWGSGEKSLKNLPLQGSSCTYFRCTQICSVCIYIIIVYVDLCSHPEFSWMIGSESHRRLVLFLLLLGTLRVHVYTKWYYKIAKENTHPNKLDVLFAETPYLTPKWFLNPYAWLPQSICSV